MHDTPWNTSDWFKEKLYSYWPSPVAIDYFIRSPVSNSANHFTISMSLPLRIFSKYCHLPHPGVGPGAGVPGASLGKSVMNAPPLLNPTGTDLYVREEGYGGKGKREVGEKRGVVVASL